MQGNLSIEKLRGAQRWCSPSVPPAKKKEVRKLRGRGLDVPIRAPKNGPSAARHLEGTFLGGRCRPLASTTLTLFDGDVLSSKNDRQFLIILYSPGHQFRLVFFLGDLFKRGLRG
jgi:hypothetical protein